MGGEDCLNNFTLQYNYRVVNDTYGSVKVRHKGNDALCQRSAARFSRRSNPTAPR